jgi:Zn finger protein HypA/HybF involved in hydrogenase expression
MASSGDAVWNAWLGERWLEAITVQEDRMKLKMHKASWKCEAVRCRKPKVEGDYFCPQHQAHAQPTTVRSTTEDLKPRGWSFDCSTCTFRNDKLIMSRALAVSFMKIGLRCRCGSRMVELEEHEFRESELRAA